MLKKMAMPTVTLALILNTVATSGFRWWTWVLGGIWCLLTALSFGRGNDDPVSVDQ